MKVSTFFLRVLLVLAAALVVLPLLWTLLNAFKTNADLLVSTPKLVFQPVLDNMSYVLNRRSVARALTNSLIICSSAVVLGAVLGVPAAYVIARFKNRITAEAQFLSCRSVSCRPSRSPFPCWSSGLVLISTTPDFR